jgi:hypothetical protein
MGAPEGKTDSTANPVAAGNRRGVTGSAERSLSLSLLRIADPRLSCCAFNLFSRAGFALSLERNKIGAHRRGQEQV